MTKNTYKSNTFKKTTSKAKRPKLKFNITDKFQFLNDRRLHLTVGFFLIVLAVFLFLSSSSYLFTGKTDQSVVESIGESGLMESGAEAANWMKLWGAVVSHYLIFKWFGIASFLIPPFLFVLGYKIVFGKALVKISRAFVFVSFFLIWISLLMGAVKFTESRKMCSQS